MLDLKRCTMEQNKPCGRRSRKKARKNPTSTEDAEMDEHIWREFPQDLSDSLVPRLPIAASFRLRSVSRRWKSLADSHSPRWPESAQNRPWLFGTFSGNGKAGAAGAYDPRAVKWRHCSSPPFRPGSSDRLRPAASSGGLVCCYVFTGPCKRIVVGNPVTQRWKTVAEQDYSDTLGMATNRDQQGVKLVCVEDFGDYSVHDSADGSKNLCSSVPAKITIPLCAYGGSMSIGSVIYFRRWNPDGILCYDTASDAWEQLLIPAPPGAGHKLAGCGGRVLMAGVESDAGLCVRVWELQKTTLSWTEIGRMPSSMLSEFDDKDLRIGICSGDRGLLVISLRGKRVNPIFMYDLTDRAWSKVPRCDLQPGNNRNRMVQGGVLFFPSLFASP